MRTRQPGPALLLVIIFGDLEAGSNQLAKGQ